VQNINLNNIYYSNKMSDDNSETFNIKELDLDLIAPSKLTNFSVERGGSKTIVIGKPGQIGPSAM
jgi:hypothetical protein